MKDKIYDANFTRHETMSDDKTDWYEVTKSNFDIYGLPSEELDVLTRRIPVEIAKEISSPGIGGMSAYGAGARALFSTDSYFVSLRVEYGAGAIPTVCNHIFTYGFDLYKSDETGVETFIATYRPPLDFDREKCDYTASTKNGGVMTQYTLNFPHFSAVKKLYIGIQKGKKICKGKKYKNEKPVVFYGSSITHGAAAGRPGNTYPNFISQKYNIDYVNLGFAGMARGEENMAKYIASLDMSVFVCDYDHNAYTLELLEETYYPFYRIIRDKHPNIPYIIVTRPDRRTNPRSDDEQRMAIIRSCYERAKAEGDENVYFINGDVFFEGEFRDSCTSDGCHPNDIGFMRMAEVIGELVNSVLE